MGMASEIIADGSGARGGKATPQRTCVVTRVQQSPDRLLRFVADPDGAIIPDLSCRLPGRGVWVSLDRKSVEAAVKSRAFARSLKRPVKAAEDLPDLVDKLLMQRLSGALSIANKAGLVVTGFTRVDQAIAKGEAAILLHASDGAADGIEKLDRRYAAMCRDLGRTPRSTRTFTAEQMSLALGRANVVHAALMMGGAAQHFLAEAERLTSYRTGKADVG